MITIKKENIQEIPQRYMSIIDHRISWSRQNVIYSICKIICFDVLILSIQVSSFFILNLI